MIRQILTATNHQRVLDFLIQNPGKEYLAREIQRVTKISKAGTNLALQGLVKIGLVKREKRGKVYLYLVDFRHPIIKQLKVLQVIVSLSSLIKKITGLAKKIILYGSASRGENTKESDIDLFVVTTSPESVKGIFEDNTVGKKIQLMTKTPLKYSEMEKTEPTFYREVEQGIVLWESKDES